MRRLQQLYTHCPDRLIDGSCPPSHCAEGSGPLSITLALQDVLRRLSCLHRYSLQPAGRGRERSVACGAPQLLGCRKMHWFQIVGDERGAPTPCHRNRAHFSVQAVRWGAGQREGWTHLEVDVEARRGRKIDTVAGSDIPATMPGRYGIMRSALAHVRLHLAHEREQACAARCARFECDCACLPTQPQPNAYIIEMMSREWLHFRSTNTATAVPRRA